MKNIISSAGIKLVVLILFAFYLGLMVVFALKGNEINMPDFIVAIITMVFMYFFRKSGPKEGGQ